MTSDGPTPGPISDLPAKIDYCGNSERLELCRRSIKTCSPIRERARLGADSWRSSHETFGLLKLSRPGSEVLPYAFATPDPSPCCGFCLVRSAVSSLESPGSCFLFSHWIRCMVSGHRSGNGDHVGRQSLVCVLVCFSDALAGRVIYGQPSCPSAIRSMPSELASVTALRHMSYAVLCRSILGCVAAEMWFGTS